MAATKDPVNSLEWKSVSKEDKIEMINSLGKSAFRQIFEDQWSLIMKAEMRKASVGDNHEDHDFAFFQKVFANLGYKIDITGRGVEFHDKYKKFSDAINDNELFTVKGFSDYIQNKDGTSIADIEALDLKKLEKKFTILCAAGSAERDSVKDELMAKDDSKAFSSKSGFDEAYVAQVNEHYNKKVGRDKK